MKSRQNTGFSWAFAARFTPNAYLPYNGVYAIAHLKEAVREIKAAAKKDPELAAEGAVLFLEKISAALMHVDSSSGALGTAIDKAVAALVPLLAAAPGPRQAEIERRVWAAVLADDMPYLEGLRDLWPVVCRDPQRREAWLAGNLAEVKRHFEPKTSRRDFFYSKAATPMLTLLDAMGRPAAILALLPPPEAGRTALWYYEIWRVKALWALGRRDEAIDHALAHKDHRWNNRFDSLLVIEPLMIEAGRGDEAYERIGKVTPRRGSRPVTLKQLAKLYPQVPPAQLVADCAARKPDDAALWIAAGRELGFIV